MAGGAFITVTEDLIEHANAVADWFDTHGYTVRIEKPILGAPYTPTLTCTRQPTTVYVEIDSRIRAKRMEEWARYCRSCNKDVRICLGIPGDAKRDTSDEQALRDAGVGLWISSDSGVTQAFAPKDMAVNVQLPDLQSMPKKMRKLVAPAYEQFDASHWQEGFRKACDVVEIEARKYLTKGAASGRIVVLTEAGNVTAATPERIEKLTLGQLAGWFGRIQNPNYADTLIAKALASINEDRVNVTHHGQKKSTEAKLRKNVGQHMWTVNAALRVLLDIK